MIPRACLWVATFMLVWLAGCQPSDKPLGQTLNSAGTPPVIEDGQSVLRRGNGTEPQTLDPHRSEGVPSSHILRDLYEGLTTESPDGTIIPGAAQSWQISEDGLTYIFHMRPNGRWSNADPVTAHDFVYGLRRSVDPATASAYALMLSPIAHADAIIAGDLPPTALGVEAIDPHTLIIHLQHPTPYMLGMLTHSSAYPVHRATIEKYGDQFSRPGKLVSNGAYLLSDWMVQSHVMLDRNPYYWNDQATCIDRIRYLAIENIVTELNRYRAGDLDWTSDVPNEQFEWLSKHLASHLSTEPWLGSYYLGLNLTHPPFKDNLALRQALSLAIDRQILTDKVTRSGQIPAYGWIPPVSGYTQYTPLEQDWSQEKREARAIELYALAGYDQERPLTVELRYNTQDNNKHIAIAVASMWNQVLGVHTRLINEEWKVFLQNRRLMQVTEVFRAGWIGDYNDAYTFSSLWHSRHGLNDTGYNNPEYDALLEQSQKAHDPEQRQNLLQKAEQILISDQPIIPIYFYVTKRLLNPRLTGWEPNIMDHHYSRSMCFTS